MQKLIKLLNEYRRLDEKKRSGNPLTKSEDFQHRDLRDTLDRYFQRGEIDVMHSLPPKPIPSEPKTPHTIPTETTHHQASPQWPEAQAALILECQSILFRLLPLEETRRNQGLLPEEDKIYTQCMNLLFRRFGIPTSETPSSPTFQAPPQTQEYPNTQEYTAEPPREEHRMLAERPYIRIRRKRHSFSKR